MSLRRAYKIRFSVRLMLCAVALFALLLTFGPPLYEWYFAKPTIPLANLVASFNARYGNNSVGKFEPPITEAEIIAAINSQLPTLRASTPVKGIYAKIARTRRVPEDALLNAMDAWIPMSGTSYTVWWINLDVYTRNNLGYGLRVRENNSPVAKPKGERKLNLPDLIWIPKSPP